MVSTGAAAVALHCRYLRDSLSTAGRLKSVYSIKGHINPITTNLVVMVFIETGAFPSQQHLGLDRTHMHTIHIVSHTVSDILEATIFQRVTQHYTRWLRGAAALTVGHHKHVDR